MLGGMLAAHEESGGNKFERDGKTFMRFYGMSSSTAMEQHAGGIAHYRASEGKAVELPFRGSVSATIQDILGGVRSTPALMSAQPA